MAMGDSAWRADDAVAYEELREVSAAVVSLLVSRQRPDRAGAIAEAAHVRQCVLEVDGFDRQAVDSALATMTQQLAILRQETP